MKNSTKKYIVNIISRTSLFIVICIGIFINPFFFFIFGGSLFLMLNRLPFEIFFVAIFYELITGTPFGVVSLPLLFVLYFQEFGKKYIRTFNIFSKGVIFTASSFVFFVSQALIILYFGGIGILGYRVVSLF